MWQIDEGHYGGVNLNGLRIGLAAHSPASLHLGNVTLVMLVDERASIEQRQAIEAMVPAISPFSIFYSLANKFLGFHYVPIEMHLDGIRSRASVPGTLELALAPMINPVTGAEEPATLTKPMGFTAKLQELCATTILKFSRAGLSYDHSGKYGEFCPFEYKSA
jgi:hypothetical protein